MQAELRERLIGAVGAAIVLLGLGYALLFGLAVDIRARVAETITQLDLVPPQPEQPPRKPVPRPRAQRASGRASPANLRNKATEIVLPPPVVMLPPPVPVIVAPQPGPGLAAASGAADRPGAGSGAGGEGNGTGSGGEGDGDGDGGDDTPPRLIHGRLRYTDLPRELIAAQASGTVGVEYRVEVDGRVGACRASEPSGDAALDRATCALIQQKFRFVPSRHPDGRAVRSIVAESHGWLVDRDRRDQGDD